MSMFPGSDDPNNPPEVREFFKIMEGAYESMLLEAKPRIMGPIRETLTPYVHETLMDAAIDALWKLFTPFPTTDEGLGEILGEDQP